jgi:hypothetical protein
MDDRDNPASTTSTGGRWRLWILLGVVGAGLALIPLLGDVAVIVPPEPTVAPTQPPDADSGSVPDSVEVIGVAIDDRHRAYALSDLWFPERHVLNDMVGNTPISVTFCNLGNCVRAFAGAAGDPTLPLTNGGRHPSKSWRMILSVNGRKFEQDTLDPLDGDNLQPFPYRSLDAVRTTWGAWKAKHPDSEFQANGHTYPPRAK